MEQFVRTGRTPSYPRGTHGVMAEYERGCRCDACRQAAAVYQRARRERIKRAGGDLLVCAALASQHLQALRRVDVGSRAVAAVTGISFQVVRRIRNGTWPRIRQSTEERIMRVTADARSDGSVVSGRDTTKRIDALREMGHTLAELGLRMGYKSASRSGLQFYRQPRVTARTAMRVEKLYKRLLCEREQRVEVMLQLARKVA